MTRYLFKTLFNTTIFVALTLTMVIWLTQSLKLIEILASTDAPFGLFVQVVGLTLPKFLEIILPISLVIAILFTYNRMLMDNELIVLRASGVDQYTLARPALILAVTVSLVLTLLTTWVSPQAHEKVQRLRQTVKAQYSAFLLREGVFNTFGNDLTVYLRRREKNGDMTGLMIHDTRDKDKPPVTIIAKRGRVVTEGGVPNIVVFEGMRQQMNDEGNNLSKLFFSRYTIEIKGLEGAVQQGWRDARERTLAELLSPDMSNPRDRENRDIFLAEAANRLASPWNALSFSMIALTSLLLGPFNRRGQSVKILLAAALVIIMQSLSLTLVNLSRKYAGAAPFSLLTTALPVFICAWLLHARGEQRLMQIMKKWNAWQLRRAERKAA